MTRRWIALMMLAGALAAAQDKPNDRRIDYIELYAGDLAKTKAFYTAVFGWKFTDYGPNYMGFEDGRINGGFWNQGKAGSGALVIIYAADLAAMEAKVRRAGGKIVKPVYPFPGGRRFHFMDPNGNELAVWSEK